MRYWFLAQQLVRFAIAVCLFLAPTVALAQDNRLSIDKIESNVAGSRIAIGDTLTVEFSGTPGVNASILLVGDKQKVREYQAQEIAPGLYTSKIILHQSDRITEGAILVRLQQGSQVVYRSLEQAFTVLSPRQTELSQTPQDSQKVTPDVIATSDLTLEFTSHQDEQIIEPGKVIILQGQTAPNAEVQIAVTTNKTLIEGIAVIQGNTQINRLFLADKQGEFQIKIPQEANAPKGLRYEITAVARMQASQSNLIQLTLIQK